MAENLYSTIETTDTLAGFWCKVQAEGRESPVK
jgi:hypothetical protein